MANRRISELTELLSSQVATNDLFLISDVSALESKKISAEQLKEYSLDGTASYAIIALSSSYADLAKTASYANIISASYSLSSSYADLAKTASYVISSSHAISASYSLTSSYAITASYAITSSVQFMVSSGFANYCDSASYLIYTAGFNNGTASAAISSSWAQLAKSSSYLIYSGIANGTASNALTASLAKSSSLLIYTGGFNGTSSYSVRSATTLLADTASVGMTVHNDRIYREFDIVTSSLWNRTTASFGWMQITASGTTARVSMQAWGDLYVPTSGMSNIRFEVSSSYGNFLLDNAAVENYVSSATTIYSASIQPFFLQGQFTVSPSPQRFSASVLAYNGATFYTESRGVRMILRATTDNFIDE